MCLYNVFINSSGIRVDKIGSTMNKYIHWETIEMYIVFIDYTMANVVSPRTSARASWSCVFYRPKTADLMTIQDP